MLVNAARTPSCIACLHLYQQSLTNRSFFPTSLLFPSPLSRATFCRRLPSTLIANPEQRKLPSTYAVSVSTISFGCVALPVSRKPAENRHVTRKTCTSREDELSGVIELEIQSCWKLRGKMLMLECSRDSIKLFLGLMSFLLNYFNYL